MQCVEPITDAFIGDISLISDAMSYIILNINNVIIWVWMNYALFNVTNL
jgi:hypothetical protein